MALSDKVLIMAELEKLKRTVATLKRKNLECHEKVKFQRILFEENVDGIIIISHGKIVLANPAAGKLLGLTPSQIIGRTALEFVHPDDRNKILKRINLLQRGKESPEGIVCRALTSDGRIRMVEGRGRPIVWNGQQSSQAIIRDVTAPLQAEEDLKEESQRLSYLFDSAPNGIIVVDAESRRIVDANPAAIRMAGGTRESIIGSICHQHICPAEIGACPIIDLKQKVDNSERVLLAAHGIKVPIIKTVIMIILEGRKHLLESFLDISKLKKVEKALQKSNEEKGALLKEIHHRVKNNMQIISSLLSLQALHLPDEASAAALNSSQSRIRSMALVHEKLYHSKDLSRINFPEYVRDLIAYHRQVFGHESSRIVSRLNMEAIYLDIHTAVPLGLLVDELASNALKHAFPEGRKGEIRISFGRLGKKVLFLSVADNGIGFPYRLDLEKAETFGMQLVQMLADQLEAKVQIEQKKGVKFSLVFSPLKYKPRL